MMKFLLMASTSLMLAMPLTLGMLGKGVVAAPAFSYRGSRIDIVNRNTYTFSACDLGTPHASRLVIIGATAYGGDITAITVDGEAATRVVEDEAGQGGAEIWQATTTANATGTIVVSVSNGTCCVIYVWAGYPEDTTPVDFAFDVSSNTAVSTALNLGKISGGFTIIVASAAGSNPTFVFTQNGPETIIENYDAVLEGTASTAAASHVNTATSTANDYTSTTSASSNAGVAVASWA